MNLNTVTVGGNLAKDPELRQTPNGAAVCSFSIGNNEVWYTGEGDARQKHERTHWFDVVCWGRLAENVARNKRRGDPVIVEGRLHFEMWEKDGQKRSRVSVMAERVHFLHRAPSQGAQADGRAADEAAQRQASEKAERKYSASDFKSVSSGQQAQQQARAHAENQYSQAAVDASTGLPF